MDYKKSLEELEVMCKPLVSYLRENCDPYCKIVVSDNQIKLARDMVGIPVKGDQESPSHQ